MNSKEILDKNAKQILRRILLGESLTKLQKEFGVDKGTITDYYRELFKSDERALENFNKVLQIKKLQTSKVDVNNEELEKYVVGYLSGNLTLEEVQSELGIHYQTFKKRMIEYISQDEVLNKKYEEKKSKRADYSNINFKKLIIEMLETQGTQADIEIKYNLKPKTLSKKILKFKDTENNDLYKACKIMSDASMSKRKLSNEENDYISDILKNYKQKDNEER